MIKRSQLHVRNLAVTLVAAALTTLGACEKDRPRAPAEAPPQTADLENLPPAHFDPIPGERLAPYARTLRWEPDAVTSTRLEPALGQGIKELHTAHHAAIRIAEFGLEHRLSAAGKELARMLIAEHRDAEDDLLRVAENLGIPLAATPRLSEAQAHRLDILTAAVGDQFERRFAQEVVDMMLLQVMKTRALQQRVRNELVSDHLEEIISMMQKHLARAKTLQRLAS